VVGQRQRLDDEGSGGDLDAGRPGALDDLAFVIVGDIRN
jgi:hypothetical protein